MKKEILGMFDSPSDIDLAILERPNLVNAWRTIWSPSLYLKIALIMVELIAVVVQIFHLQYTLHEFHEACHSVTFIVLVNSHQR